MSREKPKRGHDGPKPVTAKWCRTLSSSEEVNVNTIISIYGAPDGNKRVEIAKIIKID